MAETRYGINDPLAVKAWRRKLIYSAISKTYFRRFMGEGEDSLCQVKEETIKQGGDRVRFMLQGLLSGRGRTEGQTLEGAEEGLTHYYDDVVINELRHGVKVPNRRSIDQQRVPFQLREAGRKALDLWIAERLDQTFFNQLSGYTAVDDTVNDGTDTAYTGLNATIAPTASRRLWGGAATNDEGVTSATQKFTLQMIDSAVALAKTTSPLIPPLRIDGKDMYVAFLHPGHVHSLRTDSTAITGWLAIQEAAMMGGQIESNPIFTGALGIYNGVVLHEATRLPYGVHSSNGTKVTTCRRAVLCGAQAMAAAFGKYSDGDDWVNWHEETDDRGHDLAIDIDMIFGMKKTVFNSVDFSTIVMSAYSAY